MGEIYIGIAGWSYKDWKGIVYPERMKRELHPVEYLARYFDLIEINTSFYGHMKPESAKSWCQKAAAVNPKFLFTAKLNQCFTHSPIAVVESTSAATIRCTPKDERDAKAGYDAIANENRLGALLAQFPVSFKNTDENRAYLEKLITMFSAYPLAVEIRHDSWNNQETLAALAEQGVAFCNIDQPKLGHSIRPTEHVTSSIGYVRLHGRRYDQWFDPKTSADRYNYLYTRPELEKWKGKVETIGKKAEVTFVVANNHFQGKAPANALELKSMISGKKVKAPETLVERYPQLADGVEPDPAAPFQSQPKARKTKS